MTVGCDVNRTAGANGDCSSVIGATAAPATI
jgi:hypothetical protein